MLAFFFPHQAKHEKCCALTEHSWLIQVEGKEAKGLSPLATRIVLEVLHSATLWLILLGCQESSWEPAECRRLQTFSFESSWPCLITVRYIIRHEVGKVAQEKKKKKPTTLTHSCMCSQSKWFCSHRLMSFGKNIFHSDSEERNCFWPWK